MSTNRNMTYVNQWSFDNRKVVGANKMNYKTPNYRNKYPNRIDSRNNNENDYLRFKRFINRNWRAMFILVTIIVDTLAIMMSGAGSYVVGSLMPNAPVLNASAYSLFMLYCWGVLLSFGSILGLYRGTYQSRRNQQYRLAVKTFFFSLPLILSSFYFFHLTNTFRISFILFLSFTPVFFVIGRSVAHFIKYYMQEKGFGIRNAVIYGDCHDITKIFERMTLYPELGYQIKGFVLAGNDNWGSKDHIVLRNILPEYSISNIDNVIKNENIECILTPNLKNNEIGFLMMLDRCKKNKINFKIISPEYEDLLRFSHVKDIAGIPLYSPPRPRMNLLKINLKRIFDVLGSSVALILFSPIFLIISIAILIEDGRPLFFKQKRALVKGMGEFYFFKFRSMVKGAEKKQQDLYKENQTSGGLFLIDHDPRVTKVGKFIRKYSLDELPQFFNVLKGDMSLVGPRPLSIADLINITPENTIGGFYQLRSNSKPGITGLWQISGRRDVGFKEMVLLDLYYIENKSILLDLEIIFETVPVMLFGKGAY